MDQRAPRPAFGQGAGEIGGDEGVETVRRVGEKQLVAGLQWRTSGF